jgi:hypothetical protein
MCRAEMFDTWSLESTKSATGCAHSATAGWTGERNRTSYSVAPRSMKMGTTRSLFPYDAVASHASQSAKLRYPTTLHYALRVLPSMSRGGSANPR